MSNQRELRINAYANGAGREVLDCLMLSKDERDKILRPKDKEWYDKWMCDEKEGLNDR